MLLVGDGDVADQVAMEVLVDVVALVGLDVFFPNKKKKTKKSEEKTHLPLHGGRSVVILPPDLVPHLVHKEQDLLHLCVWACHLS